MSSAVPLHVGAAGEAFATDFTDKGFLSWDEHRHKNRINTLGGKYVPQLFLILKKEVATPLPYGVLHSSSHKSVPQGWDFTKRSRYNENLLTTYHLGLVKRTKKASTVVIFHILQDEVFKWLSCVPGNQAHRWISASKHRRADLWAISDIPTQSRTSLKMSCGGHKSPHVYSNTILRMQLTLCSLGKFWTDSPYNTDFAPQCFSAGGSPLRGAVCTPEERSAVLAPDYLYAPKKFWPSRMSPHHFQTPTGVGRVERRATVLGGEPLGKWAKKETNPPSSKGT